MDSKLHNDLRPHLERLTEKSNQVRTLALPQATADSLLHKLRIEFTHGSTAIEGNTLTLRETQLLIDEGKTPLSSKELRELHETINHDAAVGQILDLVRDNACVSEEEVRGIHRMVMKNIQDDWGGVYRQERIMVTGAPLQPGHPERIEGEMRELLAWIENNAMAVPAVAAEAHYRLVKIHPFRDGNGRTARLLMNWILLNGGYKLTVIPSEQRARYITSIDEADRGNPQEYFQFLFECIEHSLDQYLEAR